MFWLYVLHYDKCRCDANNAIKKMKGKGEECFVNDTPEKRFIRNKNELKELLEYLDRKIHRLNELEKQYRPASYMASPEEKKEKEKNMESWLGVIENLQHLRYCRRCAETLMKTMDVISDSVPAPVIDEIKALCSEDLFYPNPYDDEIF